MEYIVALTPKGIDPRNADDLRKYTVDLDHETKNLLNEAEEELISEQGVDRWALQNHWEIYAIEPPLVRQTKNMLQDSTTGEPDAYIPILREGRKENVWFHSTQVEGEDDVDFQYYNILDWLISFRLVNGGNGELYHLFEASLHAVAHRYPEALKRVNRARDIQSYESYTQNLTHKVRGLDGYPTHEFEYLDEFFKSVL